MRNGELSVGGVVELIVAPWPARSLRCGVRCLVRVRNRPAVAADPRSIHSSLICRPGSQDRILDRIVIVKEPFIS